MADINDMSSRIRGGLDIDDAADSFPEESTSAWDRKKATPIPEDVRAAFQRAFGSSPTHARFIPNTKISGFTHSTKQNHLGNSQIFFSSPNDRVSVPGFIYHILSLEDDPRLFLAVRCLLPTTVKDPFDRYPILGIKLYSAVVDDLEIILLDNVDAQFASCPLDWDEKPGVAVITLSRVSLLSPF